MLITLKNDIGRTQHGSKLNPTPEVQAYISGLTTPLSSAQVTKLDKFVRTLKTGLGISALSDAFDVMYILAGETAESSLKNLVKNAHHATAVNSPAFTALEGFTGNGTSSYIKTGYLPNTNKVTMSLNSGSLGVYSRTDEPGSNTKVEFGSYIAYNNSPLYIQLRSFSGFVYSIHSNGFIYDPIDNTYGFFIVSRNTSTQLVSYKNGEVISTKSASSNSINDFEVNILAVNYNGVPSSFSTKQLSFAFIGRQLTSADVVVLTNAIESYMDSNGKGVIS